MKRLSYLLRLRSLRRSRLSVDSPNKVSFSSVPNSTTLLTPENTRSLESEAVDRPLLFTPISIDGNSVLPSSTPNRRKGLDMRLLIRKACMSSLRSLFENIEEIFRLAFLSVFKSYDFVSLFFPCRQCNCSCKHSR